jgi:hypothetical protein
MEAAVALKDSHVPDLHSATAAVNMGGAETPASTAMLAATLLLEHAMAAAARRSLQPLRFQNPLLRQSLLPRSLL